ncbi:unnamed protein product, partial [Polarella glacialis]
APDPRLQEPVAQHQHQPRAAAQFLEAPSDPTPARTQHSTDPRISKLRELLGTLWPLQKEAAALREAAAALRPAALTLASPGSRRPSAAAQDDHIQKPRGSQVQVEGDNNNTAPLEQASAMASEASRRPSLEEAASVMLVASGQPGEEILNTFLTAESDRESESD